MENQLIKFIRQKDYIKVKEIGRGGFGRTVLLKDEIIDSLFVCKKYTPYDPKVKQEFFKNFVQEIKLLHLISHLNIVRVFNYYLYPEKFTGFILMEYIKGKNIENFLYSNPETINEIFIQVIEGFRYLESENILHRDIRPQNILINKDNIVKIIDFGFGKKITTSKDFNKSISLNLWCEPPNDFSDKVYNHSTEIYFIGKLFEKAILDNNIEVFLFKDILNKMIKPSQEDRIESFNNINRALLNKENMTINFDENEKAIYRKFANCVSMTFTKLESSAEYINNIDRILKKLDNLYKKNILEENVQNIVDMTRCFVSGEYEYRTSIEITVVCLKEFIELLKKNPKEKQKIIINNLQNRIDSIDRYTKTSVMGDDVPF